MTLRVTVEVVPAGNPAKKRIIRVMEISNMSDLADVSDYSVTVVGESTKNKKQGTVRGHQRLRWGAWKLIARAIQALNLDLEQ